MAGDMVGILIAPTTVAQLFTSPPGRAMRPSERRSFFVHGRRPRSTQNTNSVQRALFPLLAQSGRSRGVVACLLCPVIQTSTCSAIARASSTSMPRCRDIERCFRFLYGQEGVGRLVRCPSAGRSMSLLFAAESGCQIGAAQGRCWQPNPRPAAHIA